ncbi:MAG TPA: hypothetical protein VFH73_23235 [Polyangia bacterium]|nr:hypothetical protein [Polyangia bacterium]
MSDFIGFRGWGCNYCKARGPCGSLEEGQDLAQEHARGCAGYLKNWHDEEVRAAAPEMLALLKRAQEWLDSGDGRTPSLSYDIAALLKRLGE